MSDRKIFPFNFFLDNSFGLCFKAGNLMGGKVVVNVVRNNYLMVVANTPGGNVLREETAQFTPLRQINNHTVEKIEPYPSVYLWEKGSLVDIYA